MASAGTRFQPAAAATAATGRLTQKTALQPRVLTRTAATAGPPTPMTPHTDATRAYARGLRSEPYARPMQVTAVPMSEPVNSPCSSLAATSTSMVGAAAHSVDAAAKPAMASR